MLQFWIYEAFPEIGRKFGRKKRMSQIPRMHKWKPNEILSEKIVQQFLATEQV